MKKSVTLAVLAISVIACRKELVLPTDSQLVQQAEKYVSGKLSPALGTQPDWSTAILIETGKYLQVGCQPQHDGREILLVKWDRNGDIEGAKVIRIRVDEALNGKMECYALDGTLLNSVVMEKGYIQRARVTVNTAAVVSLSVVEEGYLSPPVMMRMYPTELPQRPYQLVNYVNIRAAYNNLVDIPATSYYYAPASPDQKQPAAGGSGSGPGNGPVILVDFETGYLRPPLSLAGVIACFKSIPDAGAVCSIELLTDIPVDADPRALFDWGTNSPGHAFVRLTKTAQGKTVAQNIGFYPQTSFKAMLTTAPIPGKFADDSRHEFNAAIKMSITPAELRKVLEVILATSKMAKYDIDDYNCSNFALGVFNTLRPNDPVEPVRMRIPNTVNSGGSLTPQAIYQELLRRMKTVPADRANITITTGKATAGVSVSPCK